MRGTHWINTASGRRFYYDDVRGEDFHIPDIAAALSRNCRYNGQLKDGPELEDEIYSIAQHSVYVYWLLEQDPVCPRKALPWALLHDAPEAYYTDMTSPQKEMSPEYRAAEEYAEGRFRPTHGIPYDEEVVRWVKYADIQVLWMESQVMCAIGSDQWSNPGMPVMTIQELDLEFYFWRPKKARMEYLKAYAEIQKYLTQE